MIGITRDVVVPFFSRSWIERLAPAGWIAPGSVATPDSIPQVLDLLDRLERFLKKNSRFENASPDVNVTAVQAKALHDGLDQAVNRLAHKTVAPSGEGKFSAGRRKLRARRHALPYERHGSGSCERAAPECSPVPGNLCLA